MTIVEYVTCPLCLPVGEKVLNADFQYVNISKIDVKDKVLGLSEQKVIRTLKRPYKGEVIVIKPKYLLPVRLTPEHEVLVRKAIWKNHDKQIGLTELFWIKAKNIVSTHDDNYSHHFVIIPKIKIEKDIYLDLTKYTKPYLLPNEYRKKLHDFHVNEYVSELFGWYLAEGHTSEKEVFFSLGKHEEENKKRIIELIDSIGYKSRITDTVTRIQISLQSRIMARFFRENFGQGARNKKVPPFMFYAKKRIIESLIKGYLAGDGHYEYYGDGELKGFRVNSVSEQLIRQIQLLLLKIGIVASAYSSHTTPSIINGRLIKGKDGIRYNLSFYKRRNKERHEYWEDSDFYYFPVRKRWMEYYEGYVYNLTTEENIFLVPFIVHNCGSNHPWSSEARRLRSGNPYFQWVNYDLNTFEFIQLRDARGKVPGVHPDRRGKGSAPGQGIPKVDVIHLPDAVNHPVYRDAVESFKHRILDIVRQLIELNIITREELMRIIR